MRNLYKKSITLILINLITLSGFSQLNNAFKFKITGNGYSDETIIRLLNGASVNYDGNYDAWKFFSLFSAVPSLYTQISAGQELSVNALPEFSKDTSITIYTNIPASGSYSLNIEELFPLTSNYKVSLTDVSSNTHYRILGDTSFIFTFNIQQNSPTFTFNISTLTTSTVVDETCFGMNDGELIINNPGSTNWDISILDSNNNTILNSTSNASLNNFNNLTPGHYSAKVSSKGIIDNINFSISSAPNLIADFSIDKDTAYLSNGGIVNLSNNSQYAKDYTWDFDDGVTSSNTSPSHTYTATGTYDITLLAQNTNCTTQTTKQIIVLPSSSLSTSIDNIAQNTLKVINQGEGNFKLLTSENSYKKVEIYNISGAVILEDVFSNKDYRFSLANNASGIYIIKITGEDGYNFQEKLLN
jgi:PKD repeat protein